MAATLADKAHLAEIPLFVARVTGAVATIAVAVATEAPGPRSAQWNERRTVLLRRVWADPHALGQQFAWALAGADAIADAYANATGTDDQKVAAIADNAIRSGVTQAWDAVAGVPPHERL